MNQPEAPAATGRTVGVRSLCRRLRLRQQLRQRRDHDNRRADAATTAAARPPPAAAPRPPRPATSMHDELKGVCPDTVVFQTDWNPEAEHGDLQDGR